MSISKIEKKGLKLDGSIISIFGHKGFREGDSWCITFLGDCFVQVTANPVSCNIEEVINADIVNGNGDKIHHIQVDKNIAVCLYLEGKIDRECVKEAEVTDDTIKFKAVSFETKNGTRQYDVVVSSNPEHSSATVDENGEVV